MCSALSTVWCFTDFNFVNRLTADNILYIPMLAEHLYKYCVHVVFKGCNANLHLSIYTWTDWTTLFWLEIVIVVRHNSSPCLGWQQGLCRCNTLLNCLTWTGFAVEVKSALQQKDIRLCSTCTVFASPGFSPVDVIFQVGLVLDSILKDNYSDLIIESSTSSSLWLSF